MRLHSWALWAVLTARLWPSALALIATNDPISGRVNVSWTAAQSVGTYLIQAAPLSFVEAAANASIAPDWEWASPTCPLALQSLGAWSGSCKVDLHAVPGSVVLNATGNLTIPTWSGPGPYPTAEVTMLRPDVLDGRVDWAATVLVDLTRLNTNGTTAALGVLSVLAASAGLVVTDADTGIPAVFAELRAQRHGAETHDVPGLCDLRISNHSVDAADSIATSGSTTDPCRQGAAWLRLSYSHATRSIAISVAPPGGSINAAAPLGSCTLSTVSSNILFGRQLTRMQVGLVLRTGLSTRTVAAVFTNFSLAVTEGSVSAPLVVRAFPSAWATAAAAAGAGANSTSGNASATVSVLMALPPFIPYTFTVWARSVGAPTNSSGSGGSGNSSASAASSLPSSYTLVAGPTTWGTVCTRPSHGATFPLTPARRAALGMATWLEWAGERGQGNADSISAPLLYIEDTSNTSVPAYGYQAASAAFAPILSSSFLGEHAAWIAQWNSYMFVHDATRGAGRPASLDLGNPSIDSFIFIVARLQAWYGITNTLLSKGAASTAPGYDVYVYDDPGALNLRVRSAADGSPAAVAANATVVGGVSRSGPRRSSAGLYQFSYSHADSDCSTRVLAGYENDESSTTAAMYGAAVGYGAPPLPAAAAALSLAPPLGTTVASALWGTGGSDTPPGGFDAVYVTANSSASSCTSFPPPAQGASCRPTGAGCQSIPLPPTTLQELLVGSGYSQQYGAGTNGFYGEIYELSVLNGLPNASEAAALRRYYANKYYLQCPAQELPGWAAGSVTNASYGDSASAPVCADPLAAVVSGTASRVCAAGRWSGAPPVCARKCPALPIPLGSVSTCLMTRMLDSFTPAVGNASGALLPGAVVMPPGTELYAYSTWPELPDSYWNPRVFSVAPDGSGLQADSTARWGGNGALSAIILYADTPLWVSQTSLTTPFNLTLAVRVDAGRAGISYRFILTPGWDADTAAFYTVSVKPAVYAGPGAAPAIVTIEKTTDFTAGETSIVATASLPAAAASTPLLGVPFLLSVYYVGPTACVSINGGAPVINFTDPAPLPHGTVGPFIDGAALITSFRMDTGCDEAAIWPSTEGDSIAISCPVGSTVAGLPVGTNALSISTTCSAGQWQGAGLPQLQCVPAFPTWWPPYLLNVPENSAVNTPLGPAPLLATVGGGYSITYSIVGGNTNSLLEGAQTGSGGGVFKVDACSGMVSVARAVLDYETQNNYTVVVAAVPGGYAPSAVNRTISINITNVNEPPIIVVTNFSVHELAPPGTPLQPLIQCWDSEGDPCAWNITGGNSYSAPPMSSLQRAALGAGLPADGSPCFNVSIVGVHTAALSVAIGLGGLDFETRPALTLTVAVYEPGGWPNLTTSSTITVWVLNDPEPPILPTGQLFTLPQHAAAAATPGSPATATGPVAVWYPEASQGDVLTYAIVGLWGGALSDGSAPPWTGAPSTWPLTIVNSTGVLQLYYTPPLPPGADPFGELTVASVFLTTAALTASVVVRDSAGLLSAPTNVTLLVLVDGTGEAGALMTGVALPLPCLTSGGGTLVLSGQSLGDLAQYANLTLSYGPYTTQNCVLVNGTVDPATGAAIPATISCVTVAGSGRGWPIALIVDGLQIRASGVLLFSYDAPLITGVAVTPPPGVNATAGGPVQGRIPSSPTALLTQGGQVLYLTGTGFGGSAAPISSVTYGPYAATVVQAGQTWVQITTAAGVGSSLPLAIVVNGQSSPTTGTLPLVGYSPPTITGLAGAAGVMLGALLSDGGQALMLSGTGFGPLNDPSGSPIVPTVAMGYSLSPSDGTWVYALSRCRKPQDPVLAHTSLTCLTPAGVGTGLSLAITVGAQSSNPAADLAAAQNISGVVPSSSLLSLSYVGPVITRVSGPGSILADTAGGQLITLSGSGFGPVSDDAVVPPLPSSPLAAVRGVAGLWYGPYAAASCSVSASTQLTCLTVQGTGAGYAWSLCIAGQCASTAGSGAGGGGGAATAPMSYAPPSVVAFSGDGALGGSTDGGQTVVISGRNLGAAWLPGVSSAQYALWEDLILPAVVADASTAGAGTVSSSSSSSSASQSSPPLLRNVTYVAANCTMVTPHTAVACDTVPGGGASLSWRLVVDGQASTTPHTSYGAPGVSGIQAPGGGALGAVTAGATLLLLGSNFGPPGSGGALNTLAAAAATESVAVSLGADGATLAIVAGSSPSAPLVDFVLYGPTGSEYTAVNWTVLATGVPGSGAMLIQLGAGAGFGMSVSVSVADQLSPPSAATFSFALPSIIAVMPRVSVTDPSSAALLTVRASAAGLDDPMVGAALIVGNPGDDSLSALLPITSITPWSNGSSGSSSEVLLSAELPPGLGLNRAVRIALYRRSGAGNGTVGSLPSASDPSLILSDPVVDTAQAWGLVPQGASSAASVNASAVIVDPATGDLFATLAGDTAGGTGSFLSYAPPQLSSAVVYPPRSEAEKAYLRDVIGCADGVSFCGYLALQLSCAGGTGCNYGPAPADTHDTIIRRVEFIISGSSNATGGQLGNSTAGVAFAPPYAPLSWTQDLVVTFTPAASASVRVVTQSASYWGAQQEAASQWVAFASLSPSLSGLLGGPTTGVPTTGAVAHAGLISLAAANMVAGEAIRVLVGTASCPLYANLTTTGGTSSLVEISGQEAGDTLVDGTGKAVLTCLPPPGQGSGVVITVQREEQPGDWRTSPLDTSFIISYAPPSISRVGLLSMPTNGSSLAVLAASLEAGLALYSPNLNASTGSVAGSANPIIPAFAPGMQVSGVPTNGSGLLVFAGSNLGTCPTVQLRTSLGAVLFTADLCAAAASAGPLPLESAGQDLIVVPSPIGEGQGLLLVVVAGNQDTSSQVIVMSFAPPVVDAVVALQPVASSGAGSGTAIGLGTQGGSRLRVLGWNFGAPFQGLQAAQLAASSGAGGGTESPYAILWRQAFSSPQTAAAAVNDPYPPIVQFLLPPASDAPTSSPTAVWTLCMDPVRLSHSELQCTLPEGDGQGITGQVTTLSAPGAESSAVLTYDPPLIEGLSCVGTGTNASGGEADPSTACSSPLSASSVLVQAAVLLNASGYGSFPQPALGGAGTAGGYAVLLTGTNFGRPLAATAGAAPQPPVASSTPRYCVFMLWGGRAQTGIPPVCDGHETFFGEGEQPTTSILWRNHTTLVLLIPPGLGTKQLSLSIGGNLLPPLPALPVLGWNSSTGNSGGTNSSTSSNSTAPLAGDAPLTSELFSTLPVFAYGDPVITAISPLHGSTDGGLSVLLLGYNLGPAPLNTSSLPTGYPSFALGSGIPLSVAATLATAYIRVGFHDACIGDALSLDGSALPGLVRCRYTITQHSHDAISLLSAPGIGTNRSITVGVVDGGGQQQAAVTALAPAGDAWNYDPPTINVILPQVIVITAASGSTSGVSGGAVSDASGSSAAQASATVAFAVGGANFGSAADATADDWTAAEQAVYLSLGGVACASAMRGTLGGLNVVQCTTTVTMVGPKNISLTVAGQSAFMSDADPNAPAVACDRGLVGGIGQSCLPCPVGGYCAGYDASAAIINGSLAGRFPDPVPLAGFFNINATLDPSTGAPVGCPAAVVLPGRAWCVVACDPPGACLGGNSCADGYTGPRCSSCAQGFYSVAGACVVCPSSPAALLIGLALVAIATAAGAFLLAKRGVNTQTMSIGVDYFQVLAIFLGANVQWPPAVVEMFHILSAFNLNIEVIAPECLAPGVTFKEKFAVIALLPAAVLTTMGLLAAATAAYKLVVLRRPRAQVGRHVGLLVSALLLVVSFLYLYETRTMLDVFNCTPTSPPDGNLYLQVVFEQCGIPGGTQMTLMPWALLGLGAYTIGYPAVVGVVLWRNRELVMEDQLLRAKGVGDDRLTNPNAYDFRKAWHRVYYSFKPDRCLWVLVILGRKALLAAVYVLFNKNAAFQLAAVLLVVFLAYALQVRFVPFMSTRDHDAVLVAHEAAALSSRLHARLHAALADIETRRRRPALARVRLSFRNVGSATGRSVRALLGEAYSWVFDPNTVEATLLFSTVTVALMGLMYEAISAPTGGAGTYYASAYTSVTTVLLLVVGLSIAYLAAALAIDVMPTCQRGAERRGALKKLLGGGGGSEPGEGGEGESGRGGSHGGARSGGGTANPMVATAASAATTGVASPALSRSAGAAAAAAVRSSSLLLQKQGAVARQQVRGAQSQRDRAAEGGGSPLLPMSDTPRSEGGSSTNNRSSSRGTMPLLRPTPVSPSPRTGPLGGRGTRPDTPGALTSASLPAGGVRHHFSARALDASIGQLGQAGGLSDTVVNPMFLTGGPGDRSRMGGEAGGELLGDLLASASPPDEPGWEAVRSSYRLLQQQMVALMDARQADKKAINTWDVSGAAEGALPLSASTAAHHAAARDAAVSIRVRPGRRVSAGSAGELGAGGLSSPGSLCSTGGMRASGAGGSGVPGTASAPGGTTRCPTPRRMEFTPRVASGSSTPTGAATAGLAFAFSSPGSRGRANSGGAGFHIPSLRLAVGSGAPTSTAAGAGGARAGPAGRHANPAGPEPPFALLSGRGGPSPTGSEASDSLSIAMGTARSATSTSPVRGGAGAVPPLTLKRPFPSPGLPPRPPPHWAPSGGTTAVGTAALPAFHALVLGGTAMGEGVPQPPPASGRPPRPHTATLCTMGPSPSSSAPSSPQALTGALHTPRSGPRSSRSSLGGHSEDATDRPWAAAADAPEDATTTAIDVLLRSAAAAGLVAQAEAESVVPTLLGSTRTASLQPAPAAMGAGSPTGDSDAEGEFQEL